jgi:iron(III) transport system permease protein
MSTGVADEPLHSGGKRDVQGAFRDLMAGRFGRNLGLTLLALLLAFLSLYPTLMLVYGSLHSTPPGSAGEFNLDG